MEIVEIPNINFDESFIVIIACKNFYIYIPRLFFNDNLENRSLRRLCKPL